MNNAPQIDINDLLISGYDNYMRLSRTRPEHVYLGKIEYALLVNSIRPFGIIDLNGTHQPTWNGMLISEVNVRNHIGFGTNVSIT